ncbi:hypothetical protein CU098_004455 [Rhizopus stolonifer]|uniref:Uncharacterized protein n=1 Tax=Rhizopus stolonifer TaxID=4846 RepID=A0A367JAZ5_RHIST|nr:hypothetical protein CU098_004455 [Rhizopus stolonifer]
MELQHLEGIIDVYLKDLERPLEVTGWYRRLYWFLRFPHMTHWFMLQYYRLQLDMEAYLKLSDLYKYNKKADEIARSYVAYENGDAEERNMVAISMISEEEYVKQYDKEMAIWVEKQHELCLPRGNSKVTPKYEMYIRSLYRFFGSPHHCITSVSKALQSHIYLWCRGFPWRQRKVVGNAFYYMKGDGLRTGFGSHWMPDFVEDHKSTLMKVSTDRFPLKKPLKDDIFISNTRDEDSYLITTNLDFMNKSIHSLVSVIYIIFFTHNWLEVTAANIMLALTFYILFCVCVSAVLCPVYFSPICIYVPEGFLSSDDDELDEPLIRSLLKEPLYHLLVFLFSIPVGCLMALLIYNSRLNFTLWTLSIIFTAIYVLTVLRSIIRSWLKNRKRAQKEEEITETETAYDEKKTDSIQSTETNEMPMASAWYSSLISGESFDSILGVLCFFAFFALSFSSCFMDSVSQTGTNIFQ